MNSSDACLSEIERPVRNEIRLAALAQAGAFVLGVLQACALGFALAILVEERRLDWTWLLVWLGLALARNGVGYLADACAARAGACVKLSARRRVAASALNKDFALGRERPGLIAALNDDIEALGGYAARYQPLRLALSAGMIAALALSFTQSWVAGVILFLTGPLTPLFMALIGYRAQDEASRKLDALQDMSRYFMGRVRALDVIGAFGAEQREAQRMARFAQTHRAASVGVLRIAFLSSATIDFFATLSIALVATYVGLALLGILPFSTGETITAAEGFAVLLIAPEFFAPLRRFALAYHDRADAGAAAARLAPFYASETSRAPAPGEAISGDVSAIRLERLEVGFPGGRASAPIDCVLCKGGLTAIAGPSGIGKSALLNALAGLLTPVAGRIALDGADAPEAARLGVLVGQAPFLFAGSVRENLALGLAHADDARLRRALCDVGLAASDAEAEALLARPLGEVAVGVSGGEARRIAIARALVRDPPVLLLDEPTAHLDMASERALIETLTRLASERIIVAATHSPALRAAAHQVLEVGAA